MFRISTLCLAIACTLPVAGAFAADRTSTGATPARTPALSATLTPQQRGAAIGEFVRKWGPYASATYGIDVATWSKRMVSQFSRGDASNIQHALQRTTFEGALAALSGGGHKLTDEQAINKMAKMANAGQQPSLIGLIGDTTNDLVYTPIAPCRIADTRNAGGVIAANTSRNFGAWGYADYLSFGGSNTDCGMLGEHPTAVVLNVTAVTPGIAGYATVYSGALATPPFIASINYAAGAIVNNTVVTNINPGSSPDYKIYTLAASHYVVDIIGYYDTPHATAVECVTSNVSGPLAASSTGSVAGTSCLAGYAQVSLDCNAGTFAAVVVSQSFSSRLCFYNNQAASATTGTASTTCCRIPGR